MRYFAEITYLTALLCGVAFLLGCAWGRRTR